MRPPFTNVLRLIFISLLTSATLCLHAELDAIGIADIKLNPMTVEKAKREGKVLSFGLVTESMNNQLIDRMHNTRKFKVIARGDLDAIMKEIDFSEGGLVDGMSPGAAKGFMLAGIKYLVVTTVDDFQDYEETLELPALRKTVKKRIIRFSAVTKLYDTTSGALLESANIQLGPGDRDYEQVRALSESNNNVTANGSLNDYLLVSTARLMADRVANRIIDVLYPARVIAKTGKQVTINRGDGLNIAEGQVWGVFALGEELIDPATGESLGQEEVEVGSVRIVGVTPKFSRGMTMEDNGIERGQVLRLKEDRKD